MRKSYLLLVSVLAVLLMSGCNLFDPAWVGKWVDQDTVSGVTITLDFDRDRGTVTVENSNADATTWLTVVKGSLDGDKDTLVATIRSIYVESETYPAGRLIQAAELFAYATTELGLDGLENSVSYTIVGDTMTLEGKLILILTEDESSILSAVRQ